MIKDELFDTNASLFVLSYLMKDPLLLQNEQYILNETDFYKPLQQMVFAAIFNLAMCGAKTVTAQDIDLLLSNYGSRYEYFKQNKGFDFVIQCEKIAESGDINKFKLYYDRVKKFSILRDLEANGIDTTIIYDTQADALNRDKQDEKLNKIEIKDIVKQFSITLNKIENKHIGKDLGNSQDAAKGLRELVKHYKEVPEVGLPIDGQILNFSVRGAREGKMYLYSAPSGSGKTRTMVGNACSISMPYIDEDGNVIIRGTLEHNDYQKVLYLATEQAADEIQTLILAYVSGIDEEKIINGSANEEETKRLMQAVSLIESFKDNFIIETITDPSIVLVKNRLIQYIIQDNIRYIFYDYIFTSPSSILEFSNADVKEHVALMMMSNTLKEVAMQYNVFCQSGTQLNENWAKVETGLRDQNCLRGSKAIADKADVGVIGVKINEKEWTKVSAIYNELRQMDPIKFKNKPNLVLDIYKNRRGKMNGIKIFRYFDFATCRAYDLFATTSGYDALTDLGTLEMATEKVSYLEIIAEQEKRKKEGNK